MDPICHTFAGAALAGTRLGDRSWGAKVTLVVAANLPDVDVIALAWGQNASLHWRRGWTHGVLALAVLPLVLAGLVTWWGRRRGREVNVRWLVALSYLGFLTHPALDWLNTYGMRWLMPFDGTWFYGDALFIVDPWMWLVLGGAAFLRFSTGRRALVAWGVGAVLLSLPVLFTGMVPLAGRLAWLAALGLLFALRLRSPLSTRTAQVACTAALALAALYCLSMLALQRHVHDELVERTGLRAAEIFVGPLPARLAARDVLRVGPHTYTPAVHRLGEHGLAEESPIAIESRDTRVLAALLAPCAQGLTDWLRYPFFRIDELENGGSRVHLLDARYVRSEEPPRGFGAWTVEFDAEGNVVGCP